MIGAFAFKRYAVNVVTGVVAFLAGAALAPLLMPYKMFWGEDFGGRLSDIVSNLPNFFFGPAAAIGAAYFIFLSLCTVPVFQKLNWPMAVVFGVVVGFLFSEVFVGNALGHFHAWLDSKLCFTGVASAVESISLWGTVYLALPIALVLLLRKLSGNSKAA
jgi:hypothetical protein